MTWLAYSHLGVAKRLTLDTQPGGALAGIPFVSQPVGRLLDGSGVLSRTTGTVVTVSKLSGVGTLSGTLTAVTVEGVFTFTDLKMDTVTGTVVLQFTAPGLGTVDSNSFNVTQPNTIIGCEVGTYAITGTAQTLTRGPYMLRQDEVGSYAITGTAVTLIGPANGTVLVSSDWSTGVGNSAAILCEFGKLYAWDDLGYASGLNRLASVPSTGFGFPAGMVNLLQSTCNLGEQNYTEVRAVFPEVQNGATLYYRMYFMQNFDPSVSAGIASNHVVQSANPTGSFTSDNGWTFKWGSNVGTQYEVCWTFESTGYAYTIGLGPNPESAPELLTKGVVYRFEWSMTRISSTVTSWHGRIFNDAVSTTVPLYDDSNMVGWDYAGGTRHTGTVASGYASNLTTTANTWSVVELGPNGAGWNLTSYQYAYYGGFRAMTGGTWIGPYVPGESAV